jgi:hypothetical protein
MDQARRGFVFILLTWEPDAFISEWKFALQTNN